jgi:hypothetical protein
MGDPLMRHTLTPPQGTDLDNGLFTLDSILAQTNWRSLLIYTFTLDLVQH